MARYKIPREIVVPDTASQIREINAANAQRDAEVAVILAEIVAGRPTCRDCGSVYYIKEGLCRLCSNLVDEFQAESANLY